MAGFLLGLAMIDVDGPAGERASIQFKNWDAPGIVIRGQKLANDISNFRACAAFMKRQGGEGPRLGRMLETMAGQFEKAGQGEEPRAE